MKLKIALLQLLPETTLEGNLKKGIDACRKAAEMDADIALFPEMWSCGYVFPHDDTVKDAAISVDSEFVSSFSKIADELGIAIAITFLEKHDPNPKNTVCLFDRFGRSVFKYSKVHVCHFGEDDDESVLDGGTEFMTGTLDTSKGSITVGSMICYDREFPESGRILALKGAELILVPNACPMEINRLRQLHGRAYENMTAIATCNYPTPHPDCNGHSTLFDGIAYLREMPTSRDMCVLGAPESEGIYIAELDVDLLRKFRQREAHYVYNRKPSLYSLISKEV